MSMKVTYIDHSGFVAEFGELVLIFDYYRGELPVFDRSKRIYVFVSHAHHDHFSRSIFHWLKRCDNMTYILSDDIAAEGPKGCTVHMGPRQELELDGMTLKTLCSTDEGVAFLVYAGKKTVYHAGDLNWWHWEEESAAYNEMMKRRYQHEISKIENEKIDVAFLPLDPRQGKEYCWGMNYFMEHTDTRYVFPMHMWGDYSVYDRLMREKSAASYRGKVQRITSKNQVFDLEI